MKLEKSLIIKYGLGHFPTIEEIDKWSSFVKFFISGGYAKEIAGQKAALLVFKDFKAMSHAPEADTIETLLEAVR
jgi:hypothetical protein